MKYLYTILCGIVSGSTVRYLPKLLNNSTMSSDLILLVCIFAGLAFAFAVLFVYERYEKNRQQNKEYIKTLYRQLDEQFTSFRNRTEQDLAELKARRS